MVEELIVGATAGLTVAGTLLINRVSDAVGGIAKPLQIQRVAEAEARAEAKRAVILAESEIQVTNLQRRAAHRWLEEETMNQEIIESITHQALPHLNDDAEPEKIEDDFLRNFFDKCRIVSDAQMQDVWARILAGEANNPGTFSRKTINVLADMDKGDAELFSQLCRFVWVFPTDTEPAIYSRQDLWRMHGLGFNALADLESLGLIRTELSAFTQMGTDEQSLLTTASYFGRQVQIVFAADSDRRLTYGEVAFSSAGRQLFSIVDSEPIEDVFEFMCDRWRGRSDVESVTVLNSDTRSMTDTSSQPRKAAPDTEEALLMGWLKKIDWQKGTAQIHDAGGGCISLRFDPSQAKELERLEDRYVEVRGRGRFNDQDEWTTVRVEQLRETQAWSEPFDLDAFHNNTDPKIFDPDKLVRIDLTDEEWEAFNRDIREGRKA